MEHSRFDNLTSASEYQLGTFNEEEDMFSTTSWEEDDEEEEEALDSDSASEEDEDFKAPVKYTPKKNKKTTQHHAEPQLTAEEDNNNNNMPQAPPRPTAYPTIYQKLTKASVDWCRYCGTTEGVNWRPGPWGKRTLCK
jgi:FtsZ-interacting cell division protein YlmF